MKVVIRRAKIQDIEDILRLNKALFLYETRFNSEFNQDWTYSIAGRKAFTKIVTEEPDIALVAEVENSIVGYIAVLIYTRSYRKHNPIAELSNMFVQEEYRKKGVGTLLVNEAKNQAKSIGATNFRVGAFAQNTKAIQFYQSCGFKEFEIILELKL